MTKFLRLCDDPGMMARLQMRVNDQRFLETNDGQLYIPQDDILRYKLALEAHEPLFSCLFDAEKTLSTLRRHWWWPYMRNVVMRVV